MLEGVQGSRYDVSKTGNDFHRVMQILLLLVLLFISCFAYGQSNNGPPGPEGNPTPPDNGNNGNNGNTGSPSAPAPPTTELPPANSAPSPSPSSPPLDSSEGRANRFALARLLRLRQNIFTPNGSVDPGLLVPTIQSTANISVLTS